MIDVTLEPLAGEHAEGLYEAVVESADRLRGSSWLDAATSVDAVRQDIIGATNWFQTSLGADFVIKADGQIVGRVGFGGIEAGEVEPGCFVRTGYEGRGVMTRAAELVGDYLRGRGDVTTVIAMCEPDNVPAHALVRRLGFADDGVVDDQRPGDEAPVRYLRFTYAIR